RTRAGATAEADEIAWSSSLGESGSLAPGGEPIGGSPRGPDRFGRIRPASGVNTSAGRVRECNPDPTHPAGREMHAEGARKGPGSQTIPPFTRMVWPLIHS